MHFLTHLMNHNINFQQNKKKLQFHTLQKWIVVSTLHWLLEIYTSLSIIEHKGVPLAILLIDHY